MVFSSPQEALSLRILQNCRNELMDLFPYLDGAFACLGTRFHTEPSFYTDGRYFYVSPVHLLSMYEAKPSSIRRGYLHTLLHCLYQHPFHKGIHHERWDLACDIACEHLIHTMQQPRLELPADPIRSTCFAILGSKASAAEHILLLLQQGRFPYTDSELQSAFSFDDHRFWYTDSMMDSQGQWEEALRHAGQQKRGKSNQAGTAAGSKDEMPLAQDPSVYDYRKFLRRFTVTREELELDTDSFDYVFYNLGMEYYGSMPLIEPLEYKEVSRLEELVIAIDTSGSCSRQTVSRFLAETYSILSQRENFFQKMNVYFLQCDCVIQDAAQITSKEDWLDYSKKIKIQGRGGTDFRPVFEYVNRLRTQKKLKNLRAILYFTDGDGIYPTQPPDIETAFVFLKETNRMDLAPGWAKKLLITTHKEYHV